MQLPLIDSLFGFGFWGEHDLLDALNQIADMV